MLGDASQSIVIRSLTNSTVVSYVQNSLTDMLRNDKAATDAIHLYSLGQSGPAGFGNGGSSGLPPEFQPFEQGGNSSFGGHSGGNGIGEVLPQLPHPEPATIDIPPLLIPPPQPPTVTTDASVVSVARGNATVAFTFSVAPTDFVLADISATGGTLSNFVMVDATHYTATFTADPNIEISNASVSVIGGSYHDTNGNTGLGGTTTFSVDTIPPTVEITTNDSDLKIGDVAHLTFTLREPATNFDVTDIAVTGGVLSNFTGSGTHYTADITPPIGSTTPITVDVATGTFTDAAGNDNIAAPQLVMTVDTVSTATWSISGADSVIEGGNPASYTVHLAGTLQAGQTATIDLAVNNLTATSADYANFAAAVNAAITAAPI